MTKINVQENNEQVLSCLQEAVNLETTSRNLYFQRGVYWRNVGLTKLADYYVEQAGEDHAQRSADRLAFLGGELKMNPTSQTEIITGDTISAQFTEDLEVEVALADKYAAWIGAAEVAEDYITVKVWWGVLQATQEHCAWLTQQLKQIELMGEDNYISTWKS
jgi:bacterioferritin